MERQLSQRIEPSAEGVAGLPPLNIFRTLARNEPLSRGFLALGGHVLRGDAIPAREREIVILRVGWRCKSVYEFGQHTVIGLMSGLSQDDVAALTHEDPGTRWSDRERDFIAAADDLCLHDEVSQPTWDRLAAQLSAAELVELVMLAGFYRLVSGSLRSFGVQLDEGVPGWPAGADGV